MCYNYAIYVVYFLYILLLCFVTTAFGKIKMNIFYRLSTTKSTLYTKQRKKNQKWIKLEKVAIIAMYCHLRPPDATAFPTEHLLGLHIWAASKPNAVSLTAAVGRHVNAAQRVCDGLGRNKIVRVGKNSGPVLSRLWTKVHEILGQRRRPFVLSNVRALLSMSRFIQQIFVNKSQIRRKTKQIQKCFGPIFSGGTTANFLLQIVSATYRDNVGDLCSLQHACLCITYFIPKM